MSCNRLPSVITALPACLLWLGLGLCGASAQTSSTSALVVAHVQNTKTMPIYDVFEITFRHEGKYTDPFFDVAIDVTFTSPSGKTVRVGGFHYGSGQPPKIERAETRDARGRTSARVTYRFDKQDLWKARLAPWELGEWKYTYVFRNAAGGQATGQGGFTCVKGRHPLPGFVRQDPGNPLQWKLDDGTPYFPVGLQSGHADHLGLGSLVAGAAMEGPFRLDRRPGAATLPAGAMFKPGPSQNPLNGDVYFRRYGKAGFNLFRFSNDTGGNQKIMEDLDHYLVYEAIMLDELFQYARKYGFRVYFTIIGDVNKAMYGTPPDDPAVVAKVKRYIEYCVNRWGATVDFWELLNEAYPDIRWYAVMAPHLKAVDPYRHPVSTSYECPEAPDIDINSPHWYSEDENPLDSDIMTTQRVMEWRRFGKPVILGEQGNDRGRQRFRDLPRPGDGGNWNPDSAVTMRIRTWTAFVHEAAFIFWETNYAKDGHFANIWLGPKERQYVKALSDAARCLGGDIVKTRPLADRQSSVTDYKNVRGCQIFAKERALVYMHHFTSHSQPVKGCRLIVKVPKAGKAYWYSPENGAILGAADVKEGPQTLDVPEFVIDIALLVNPVAVPDADGDGLSNDVDDDDDNDGVPDAKDAFPLEGEEWQDTDGDGIGDVIDADDDGDGVGDDQNGNGIPDWEEPDIDGDGYKKGAAVPWDAFPWDPKEWRDTDGDGIGDNADTDDDGDGFSDEEETRAGTDPLNRLSFPTTD